MMKQCKLISILFLLSLSSNLLYASSASTQQACPAFPFFQPQHGPLAQINCDFHHQYEDRVAQEIKTFGAPGGRPVILNLGGNLELKYNGKTETTSINPMAAYHDVKAFDHAVFTIFIILSQHAENKLDEKTLQSLHQLYKDITNAEKAIPTLGLSAEGMATTQNVANSIQHFLNKLFANKYYTKAELIAFRTDVMPSFSKLIKMAAQAELNALDDVVNRWLAKMSAKDKEQVGIVVATAHQSRAEEISMQYFAKKFGKHVSEGAKSEDGLVVLEGKFDEASALALLARHYLDREVSAVLFDDPARLQRDLLADAGREVLESKV